MTQPLRAATSLRVSGCRGSGAPPVLGSPADLGAQCSRAGKEGHHAERSNRTHGRDGRESNGQSFDAKFTDLVIRLIVVGFFAYLSLTLLAPFAIMVIWAVILAVALYPAFAACGGFSAAAAGWRRP